MIRIYNFNIKKNSHKERINQLSTTIVANFASFVIIILLKCKESENNTIYTKKELNKNYLCK